MSIIKTELGIAPAAILLPKDRTDLRKWCVIACDQYTSDRSYWDKVRENTEGTYSTYNLILPECCLNDSDVEARISKTAECAEEYLRLGVFEELPAGYMLISRTQSNGKERKGLLCSLDLERYDFSPKSDSMIRATEGTITDRIPPRLKVRSRAVAELPHIMVLIDDPQRTVIEPLFSVPLEKMYDSELDYGMGSIKGYFVPADSADGIMNALSVLKKKAVGKSPLLYAVGDGNHSLATAKAYWDMLKPSLSAEDAASHPARYAMCELVNIYDPGLAFEAIHRVVFCKDGEACLSAVTNAIRSAGYGAMISDVAGGNLTVICHVGTSRKYLNIAGGSQTVPAAALDSGIASYLSVDKKAHVDYVHGESEAVSLGKNGVAFILPSMAKSELFPYVANNGPLPRKSFSMGSSNDKRCYLEARLIK